MSAFIRTYPRVVDPELCSTIVERFTVSQVKTPGRTGGGVQPQRNRSAMDALSGGL